MKRLLVLRPEPGARATAARARALGLEPLVVSLFEVEPVAWQAPDPGGFDGLLLTSANALRHDGPQLERLRALPAYAVGEATANAAREAGFTIAATGDSGVEQLLGAIDPGLRLLHLCGEDRWLPKATRQSVTPVVVYRSTVIEAPDLSEAAGTVALIHSPRAGRRFAELVRDRAQTTIAAISPAAADAVGGGWAEVSWADAPTDEAMLALAARLCQNRP